MKKGLLILLAALLILSLAACGGNEADTPKETTSVSAYKSDKGYEAVNNILSWEKINAFPIKRSDMTEDEMRQLVVDFYIFSKTFVWVADDEYTYQVADDAGTKTLIDGGVYAGFPYVSRGSGNVYRFMDFMDPQTGVIDIKAAGEESTLFGNQCSLTTFWAWARVSNSLTRAWTRDIVQRNGYLTVGTYTYPEDLRQFSEDYGTGAIIEENGRDVMFASYAQLKIGDGLVCNNPGGHAIMCTGAPHIEYTADGKIDPNNSYILISDQTRTTGWLNHTNESGDNYQMCGRINFKMNFSSLLSDGYIPVTIPEFSGADPIEETEITFSHSGETITTEQLFSSSVTCNYSLSDIYAIITDSKGNEVYRAATRARYAATMKLEFSAYADDGDVKYTVVWGDLDDLSDEETYTLKVVAQINTGERPTLWEGKFEQ